MLHGQPQGGDDVLNATARVTTKKHTAVSAKTDRQTLVSITMTVAMCCDRTVCLPSLTTGSHAIKTLKDSVTRFLKRNHGLRNRLIRFLRPSTLVKFLTDLADACTRRAMEPPFASIGRL